jgi:hypothetical protein
MEFSDSLLTILYLHGSTTTIRRSALDALSEIKAFRIWFREACPLLELVGLTDQPAGIANTARALPVRWYDGRAWRSVPQRKLERPLISFVKEMRHRGRCAGSLLSAVLHEMRDSIVGTRKDLAEAIEFASEGKVKAHIHQNSIENINDIFTDLKARKVDGRIVIKFQ